MSEISVGLQVVAWDGNEGEYLMGTVRAINSEKIAVWVDGDPANIVHWYLPKFVRSYADVYGIPDPTPNVFVSPSTGFILTGWIEKFLEETVYTGLESPTNPKNKNYDPEDKENDSWYWTVKEMKDILERISK